MNKTILILSLVILASCSITAGNIPERKPDAVVFYTSQQGVLSTAIKTSDLRPLTSVANEACKDAGFKNSYEGYKTHKFNDSGVVILGIAITDIKTGVDVWCKK